MSKISEKEWEIAESKANKLRNSISKYFTESVVPSTERYVKVEVLIPLTENINQTFVFEAPYEYMDADNTQLKEYFNKHIYPIEPVTVLNESVNEKSEFEIEQGEHDPNNPYLEMAQIKWGFMSIKLAIYGDEGLIPHFHFYKGCAPEKGIPKDKINGGGCICITSPNYFSHGNHNEKLSSKEIEGLKEFLKKQNKLDPKKNNWEMILLSWGLENPDRDIVPLNLKMPNWTSDMETIQNVKKKK